MHNPPKNIVDQFGREHDYLRISLTERCNLRCFYCMPEEGIQLRDKSEFMTSEETLHIAKVFTDLGVKKIRLTGGEPLIKKDAPRLIEELGKLPVELAITTNGILIDKFIDVFKKAGLQNVNVSLDSLQEEKMFKITRRDYFEKIMSGIHLLLLNNFNVKINAVVMKGVNDNEITDFIHWTKSLPLHVRFIEFMPFDGNQWNWDKKVSYKEMMDIITLHFGSGAVIRIADAANDTAKNYRIQGHEGTFGIISPVTNPFCDTCNRIRLTADGKIKNCLFSSDESDLLSALRRGEDIVPLIINSIWHKKKERAGISSFSEENRKIFEKNRSMTTIGG